MISKIAREHRNKTFGFLDEEDIEQEIWSICLEKIDTFKSDSGDQSIPDEEKLEHYLRSIVSNRLVNRFKKITKSVRSPCPKCPYYKPDENPSCGAFGEEYMSCDKYRNYQLSVESRNSLLVSVDSSQDRSDDYNLMDHLAGKEIIECVEKHISQELLYDFKSVMRRQKVPKHRMEKLKKEILRILEDNDILFWENDNG